MKIIITSFEKQGVTFTKQGDYFLPDLTIVNGENAEIGVWGQRHKRYLKGHHRVRYYNLLTSGKMNIYLADIEEQVQKIFELTVKLLAEKENITEIVKENSRNGAKDEQYSFESYRNC